MERDRLRMLQKPSSGVLTSLKASTVRISFSEVGGAGGGFPFAKIYSRGERPTRSAVCTSSAFHSLRPCWAGFFIILWVPPAPVASSREFVNPWAAGGFAQSQIITRYRRGSRRLSRSPTTRVW